MSTISSLEVYRQVLLSPENDTFIQEVSTLGRSFFDREGDSVASGQDDITVKTTVEGARYRDASRLNYYHLSVSGLNVKKFGRKIINARDRLEDGPTQELDVSGINIPDRIGKEPLEDTLDFIKTNEFNHELDEPIKLTLRDIYDVEYQTLFPGKRIIVLKADENDQGFESAMLKRMSEVVSLAIKHRGPRLFDAANQSIVDTVPILDTREHTPEIIEAFKKRVAKQLLPMEITLSGVEFHTKY